MVVVIPGRLQQDKLRDGLRLGAGFDELDEVKRGSGTSLDPIRDRLDLQEEHNRRLTV